MKSQRDISLRIRFACLALLALFIALAAVAYFSGWQVKRNSERIATDAVPGTISAHYMRMAMSRGIGWVMVAASAQTTQSRDASLKTVHDADVAFTNAVKEYEATIKIDSAQDRALLNQVTNGYAEYYRQRSAYEALILAGDHNGSAVFLESNLVPVYASAIQSAEELLKYNHSNSVTYGNHIRNSVQQLHGTAAVVMVLALICAVVLITNFAIRRQEMVKLRESEEKFSKAFQAGSAGIVITEMETGEYLEVNESFCRLMGYTPQELIGRTPVELGIWRTAKERNEAFQSLRAGQTLRDYEMKVRARQGGERTVLVNADLIELGGKSCIVSLVEDVTERKRAVEQLEMLKVSIDNHFDAAYWMDIDNQFVYVNDSACKALGYTREELLGQPVTLIAPNATPKILQEIWKCLRTSGFVSRESMHRRKNGSQFQVEIVASYVRFEGKEFNCGFARDITERKCSQDELIWKTALLEAQVDATLDGLLVVDTMGRKILQNQAFLEMFKVPEEVERDDDDAKMLQHVVNQMKNPQQFRERVIHLYGHPNKIGRDEIELADGRVFDRYSAPVRDKAGQHFGRIWTFRDITERRRGEEQLHASGEALRESEQRLRLALDAGQIGVWHQDISSGAFTADDRLFDLFDLPLNKDHSIPVETWFARVHAEDRTTVVATLRALWTGTPKATVEFRSVRTDGSIRQVVGTGVSVTGDDDTVKRLVGITFDVTERKKAEQERETLLHDLGERVKELKLLNQTALLLQQNHSSLKDLLIQWVLLFPAAWQYPECCEARVIYADIEVQTPGWRDSQWKQSARIRTSDSVGQIDVVYLEPKPPADEGPFLAEERTVLNSLSEMLVGYLELRRHQENLELLVESRTRDMSLAKEEAERANRAKGQFLANISHEIRTPMNAILGYAQLLENDPNLATTPRKKASIIRSSGDHLLQIVNDVLEMSRIEAGRVKLVQDVYDLRSILEDVRNMFVPLAAAKRNELVFEFGPGLPEALVGDVGKVRQVVINLLSNAVKFTNSGKIHVQILAQPAAGGDFAITIQVVDSGRGIAEQDLVRIFSAFEQTESGLRAGGTGLGLTISRTFARMMGGDLTATSRPGEGSTFQFAFTAEAAPAGTVVDRRLSSFNLRLETAHLGCKVLVVDDIATNRDVLADLLTRTGFEVRTAADGEEGISVHNAWSPQLVLMDIRMPGIDGIEAIRRLRANGSRAVLVALTASSLPEAREEVLKVGGNDMILKPYRERDLLQAVGRFLGLQYTAPVTTSPQPSPEPKETVTSLPLSELLRPMPVDLLEQLREAVLEARLERIETLAAKIGTHSALAAEQIVTLARDFQYDELLSILTAVEK